MLLFNKIYKIEINFAVFTVLVVYLVIENLKLINSIYPSYITSESISIT
jgi:hypothetical protein